MTQPDKKSRKWSTPKYKEGDIVFLRNQKPALEYEVTHVSRKQTHVSYSLKERAGGATLTVTEDKLYRNGEAIIAQTSTRLSKAEVIEAAKKPMTPEAGKPPSEPHTVSRAYHEGTKPRTFFLNEAHELPHSTKSEERRRRKGLPPSKDQRIRDLEHELKQLTGRFQTAQKANEELQEKVSANESSATMLAVRVSELEEQLDNSRLAHRQDVDRLTFLLEEARAIGKFWSTKLLDGRQLRNQEDFARAKVDLVFGALWRAKITGGKISEEDWKNLAAKNVTLGDLNDTAFAMGYRIRPEFEPNGPQYARGGMKADEFKGASLQPREQPKKEG